MIQFSIMEKELYLESHNTLLFLLVNSVELREPDGQISMEYSDLLHWCRNIREEEILHALRVACADHIITNEIIMCSLEVNGLLTLNNLCAPCNVKLLSFFSIKKNSWSTILSGLAQRLYNEKPLLPINNHSATSVITGFENAGVTKHWFTI